MKKVLLIVSFIWCGLSINAQQFTQTLKGTVIDKSAQYPLIGVNVVLLNKGTLMATTTDIDGNFKLEKVPVGRQALKCSYIGYEEVVLANILVNSAKEAVLNIEMEEKVSELGEVVVTAEKSKDKAINEMASVSARTISIEEMSRFSGSIQDPARMAQNYAGVAGASDDRNDIIVRGNSPTGVLWRLEGVDIPSPNHFSALGTTGGPVGMLNANNLKNSDFLSSAFPAEYGNALSSVFDLKLRTGNTEQFEFLGQIGFNGFELGTEGPLSIGKNASFMANYRYSTLGVFQTLGINFGTGAAVPEYQDLTFKINIPTEKAGRFSLWGLVGLSYIEFLAEDNGGDNLFNEDNENSRFESNTGTIGLSHLYFFNNNTYSKLNIAASAAQVIGDVEMINEDGSVIPFNAQDNSQVKYNINWKFNKKFNAKNRLTFGLQQELFDINVQDSVFLDDKWRILLDFGGTAALSQVFVQYQNRINDKLKLNLGLHGQYFNLSNTFAIEPRLGLQWEANDLNTFSLGAGMHSQLQPIVIYFIEDEETGKTTNDNLDFTKSIHLATGWDRQLNENMRIKIEAYYQYLYSVPVDEKPSHFSMLNTGADFGFPTRSNLVNEGTGENYGLELTIEKFFSNNYYFLITGSVFESNYTGSDEVRRNTLFNTNYVTNLLAGKEFKLSDKFAITVDAKVTYAGGRRYTPILLEESIAAKETVRDDNKVFEERYKDYFRPDLKIGFRQNAKKISQTFYVDMQNFIGSQNIFVQDFKASTNSIATTYQRGFFPNVLYQILF